MAHDFTYVDYDHRDALAEKTAEGMAARANQGLWNGGQPPFGYDLAYLDAAGGFLYAVRYLPDGTKQVTDAVGNVRQLPAQIQPTKPRGSLCRLVPGDPARIELVRRIFDWYTRDGLGPRQIADLLNDQPVPPPRGGEAGWTLETVRQLLRNPVYCGDTVWNRPALERRREVYHGDGPCPDRGSECLASKRETHVGLITRHLFERAQSMRSDRAESTNVVGAIRGQGATSEYLLTGLVRCDHCGKPWRARPPKKGVGDQTVYYACGTYITRGHAGCPKCLIPQEKLDQLTIAAITEQLRGALTGDGFEEILIALCGAELTAAGIELTREEIMQAAQADELRALVQSWPVNARRSFVRAFIECITITPDTGKIDWVMVVPR